MLKRWVTPFELPEFIEVHAVVEQHGSNVFSFEQNQYIYDEKTVPGCCCLIEKRKCPATKEWRANGCSTDKRKRSRFCHEIALELARNESNMKMDTAENCEGAFWILFFFFFFFYTRRVVNFSHRSPPPPTFFGNAFYPPTI